MCYCKENVLESYIWLGMHNDSTILTIKCLLRYSQHNLLKYGVNKG